MRKDFVRLRSFALFGEAELWRRRLEAEGLRVDLRGEHLTGLVGQLPVPEAQVELWVHPEDLERARAVLDRPATTEVWTCGGCKEENPADFDLCFRCQRPRGDSPTRAADVVPRSPPRTGPALATLCAVLGLSCGVLAFLWWDEKAKAPAESSLFTWVEGADGCTDVLWKKSKARSQRHCDRDRNGVLEELVYYDRGGEQLSRWLDADQDGIYERGETPLEGGRGEALVLDADQNGRAEKTIERRSSGLTVHWFDADENGIFERRELWLNGALELAQEDRGPLGLTTVFSATVDAGL